MGSTPGNGDEFPATSAATQSPGTFTPPRIGASLGRYQIVSTLGHGAMATVFRASDPQLGRDVALKVMGMAHAARGGASERFRREAHAVAKLRHPGIVEIFDFVDATETEPSYIVAELIEGPTLRKLMEQAGGRLLPEFAAVILVPLVEALSVAHDRGIIHRDVKPDNVMVEISGKGARVVLTDFGIAHITGLESMTATGAMVGSPAYMSPEQARGHEVGPGTDIWSLGTMLYELATGTVPFPGKDPYTVVAAILKGTFRPPAQVVATVGREFEAIVMRCLKPRASERYASATALAADLRSFAHAAGLVPVDEALRHYLDDPATANADLRPRVAATSMARARAHARRGQIARALSEIGHATAYVPDHPGANRLLRRLSAGRTALRIGFAVAAIATALAIVLTVRPLLKRELAASKHRQPVPVVAPTKTAAPEVPVPKLSPPPRAEPAPARPPTENPTPTVATTNIAKTTAPVRKRGVRRRREPPVERAVTPPPPPTTPVAKPEPVPVPAPQSQPTAPTPRQAPPRPLPGTIALFARGGFCYPSLDDHAPSTLMPVFRDVPPGVHKIYCSRTKSSPKQLAGQVDLPPGARIERTVTEKDGRLSIARRR